MADPSAEQTKLLTPEETAKILGVQVQTLSVWRNTGRHNLPFCKIGRKFIRYRADDIENWLAKHRGTNSRAIASAVA